MAGTPSPDNLLLEQEGNPRWPMPTPRSIFLPKKGAVVLIMSPAKGWHKLPKLISAWH